MIRLFFHQVRDFLKNPVMIKLIKEFAESKSILGVCLGHQAIAEVFGAKLVNIPNVFHGVQTQLKLWGMIIFFELPEEILAGRYHSWIVSKRIFQKSLR